MSFLKLPSIYCNNSCNDHEEIKSKNFKTISILCQSNNNPLSRLKEDINILKKVKPILNYENETVNFKYDDVEKETCKLNTLKSNFDGNQSNCCLPIHIKDEEITNQIIKNCKQNDEKLSQCSEYSNDYLENLNVNVNNKFLIPSIFNRKNYLTPKLKSSALMVQTKKFNIIKNKLEFGIKETLGFITEFPNSLCYEKICPSTPPYVAPILISLLEQLDQKLPPIANFSKGTSMGTIKISDSLLSTLLQVNIKDKINEYIKSIYLFNIPTYLLTNTLQCLFQRLRTPLLLATKEFCELATFGIFDLHYQHFGCIDVDVDIELLRSLTRCIAILSNYQVANLSYFIERCQRWIRHQIKYELEQSNSAKAEVVYADAAATLTIIFGKWVVGIPKSFVAQKLINESMPLMDDVKRIIFYFLLGIPPFELWHMWSINTLCFENNSIKSNSSQEAFLKSTFANKKWETLPFL